MRGPTGTVRLVDVLATGALRPHEVKSNLLHIHREVAGHLGHDEDDSGARMYPPLFLRFGNALNLMDA